jgi:hypothetical protein
MRVSTIIGGALLGVAAAACSPRPQLEPAPRANETPGMGEGATAVRSGVTVEARAGAWTGQPGDLATKVTPMMVTITNGGAVPLRVQYEQLHLVAADGRMFSAIPPYDVKGTATQRVTTYVSPVTGFAIAPYLSPYYPGLSPVTTPFAYDPLYYDNYYNVLVRSELPTADMVMKALPEGVLSPGGSVGGFVYFEHVGENTDRLAFHADLVNAATGAQFAVVTIPFTVTEGD